MFTVECTSELRPNDPYGVAEEDLNMACTLNLSHSKIDGYYNASHLFFNVSGDVVRGAPWVRVVNRSTAVLQYRLKPSQHRSFVECLIELDELAYVGQQYLWVGCKFSFSMWRS